MQSATPLGPVWMASKPRAVIETPPNDWLPHTPQMALEPQVKHFFVDSFLWHPKGHISSNFHSNGTSATSSSSSEMSPRRTGSQPWGKTLGVVSLSPGIALGFQYEIPMFFRVLFTSYQTLWTECVLPNSY